MVEKLDVGVGREEAGPLRNLAEVGRWGVCEGRRSMCMTLRASVKPVDMSDLENSQSKTPIRMRDVGVQQ